MIINRYLIREVAGPFAAVSAVLVVVFMTYSLTVFLTDASQGLLSAGQIAALTLLKSVIALEVLLPIALYVAVMLGMGRLYNDSEMDALRAAGMGELQIVMPMLRLALILAILVGLLSSLVRPLAYRTLYTLRAEAEASSEIDRIKAGRFYSYANSGRTVFIETTGGSLNKLQGVFVRTRNAEGLQVISARQGKFVANVTGTHHELALNDASVFKRTAQGRDVFAQFAQFTIRLPIKQPEPVTDRPKLMSNIELATADGPRERAELEGRLSNPLSALLLAMLAVPLSRSRPRQGRYARMLVALVVYTLYYNLLDITRTSVQQGNVPTLMWVPGLLALTIIVWYVPWRTWLHRKPVSAHAPD